MKIKIAQVSKTTDEACGIGNYSKNFANRLSQMGIEVYTVNSVDIQESTNYDAIIYQHEHSLISPKDFINAGELVPRIALLHSDSSGSHSRTLNAYCDAYITMCDGMIETDKPVYNHRMPGQDKRMIDREDLRRRFGWQRYDKVIGSCGFMNPVRFFPEIVDAICSKSIHVGVYIACSKHFRYLTESGHKLVHKKLQELDQRYPNFIMETEFGDFTEKILKLQACNLNWCYTNVPSTKYASASASDLYATGTRLIINSRTQHSAVLGLPNVVSVEQPINGFIDALWKEVYEGPDGRHHPGQISWSNSFCELKPWLQSVIRDHKQRFNPT